MSFGGFGNNTAFGGSTTNNTGSLFGGGFGNTNNANTGGGFGNQNTSAFGTTANNTGGGFGGFGATNNNTNNNAFGAVKPAFGGTTANTGGLFGNNNNANAAAGGGGFGGGGFGTTANNNTTTGFGATGATGGSLFGATKPTSTFGGSGTTLFGGTAFGANNNTTNTAFGTSAAAGNIGECQGTAQPPYVATTEKEANTTATQHFQSIVHMQPYAKWSFEELRLADYNAGRRFANANGQAGGFGVSTGFGGFSNNNNNQTQGSLFGNNNNNTGGAGSLFGNTNTTPNTGFGAANQGGTTFGGFGTNKPAATGGLFGSTANNATTGQTSLFGGGGGGGGFGTTTNNTGFGTSNTTTGGFGANNAAKPSLFGTSTANTGGSLFGNTNSNANAGGGLFGTNTQTASTGFGTAQPAANTNPFGGASNTGGGLFGNNNNQSKPSLFSTTPASNTTSLFGGTTQTNNTQSGGLFGNNNAANNTGGLFGAAKPATTSLFGNAPAQQNSGSSLFGNTQNQPTQGGLGLFGNANKPSGGLFGSSTNQNNTGSSLFGAQQQQQQQPQNSLFGNSFNASQATNLQPPQGLTASIFDHRPYGSVSIFDGLPPPPAQSTGPIATPITSGQKSRKPAVLPQWKLNPTMSPRFVTPQKQGYGFSYSRYGTPSSISSVASTPGHFGNSLLGASIGRNIGKSVSVSNLRRNYDADGESILAPGAFTSSSRLNGQHSLKKLNIDRSLRGDLFAPIPQGPNRIERGDSKTSSSLKKRVSFEASSYDSNSNQEVAQVTDDDQTPTPSAEEQGYLRSPANRNLFNGQPTRERRSRDASPVKGNELAIVPEDASPEVPKASLSTKNSSSSRPGDPQPGNYVTRPSIEELKSMTPDQLKNVSGFVISRENVGSCAFQRPVDLSWIKWDKFFDIVVKFHMRTICIYPDQSKKPPVGMGINVPSVITLENCWPRSRNVRSGPRLDKHIKHLQSVNDCKFISYNVDNGEWTFEVPHFTTYGLDYEDQDDMDVDSRDFKSSVLSDTFSAATPDFLKAARAQPHPLDSRSTRDSTGEITSHEELSPTEDTFGFKGAKSIPGGFDAISISDDEDVEMEQIQHQGLSFLESGSAGLDSEDEDKSSQLPQGVLVDNRSLDARDGELDLDMAGAFPEEPLNMPKSILKKSAYGENNHRQSEIFLGDDWAEQLQRTISPRKYDRQELKANQVHLFQTQVIDNLDSPIKKPKVGNARLETSIDLMNSLFGKEDLRGRTVESGRQIVRQGFKWPYNKEINADATELDAKEQAFHESFKPAWGPGNLLVHAISDTIISPNAVGNHGPDMRIVGHLASEGQDIRLSKFNTSKELIDAAFDRQFDRSNIVIEDGIPHAKLLRVPLAVNETSSILPEEALIWDLASILFDKQEDEVLRLVPAEQKLQLESRIKKERLSVFWRNVCEPDAMKAVASSQTAEERAIHYLSMGAIVEACNALTTGKDFRLATLISQIGGNKIMHQDMAQQIKEWRRLNVLSEMSESIRALYEMLAGNVCVCEGRQGAVEDRASTFTISQRFRLNWARAFGLRLWYALEDNDPLEAAVERYLKDLGRDEKAKPQPWFLEKDGYNPPWSDPTPEVREDVLWGLLRLFASTKDSKSSVQLADIVAPENVRGNPMDNRLSWELYTALQPHLPQQGSPEAADKLAISFAAELESANKWTWAIFILLHLSNAEQRQHAIRDILGRQAAVIDIDNDNVQTVLFAKLQIPRAWAYEAKALYARAVKQDRSLELHYLQLAGNWTGAHSVLCNAVAPKAIIERDHVLLSKVLTGFERAEQIHTWRNGGAVYQDYVSLLSTKEKSEHDKLLKRLVRTIPGLANVDSMGNLTSPSISRKKRKGTIERSSGNEEFLRHVAVQEMSTVVGDMILQNQGDIDREHATLLGASLSNETRRSRTVGMALEYYHKVMAIG